MHEIVFWKPDVDVCHKIVNCFRHVIQQVSIVDDNFFFNTFPQNLFSRTLITFWMFYVDFGSFYYSIFKLYIDLLELTVNIFIACKKNHHFFCFLKKKIQYIKFSKKKIHCINLILMLSMISKILDTYIFFTMWNF